MFSRVKFAAFQALLLVSLLAAFHFQEQRPQSALPGQGDYPWVYLRDGRAVQAGEPVIEVIAVGDINLGRGVAGQATALDEVTPWLRSADLAFGNLECAIAPGGALPAEQQEASPQQPYLLVAPPEAAGILQRAGFDLLGLANNHALDRGPAGLAETAGRLKQARIQPVGAGMDAGQAYLPVFKEVQGVRLAFLAFNAVPSPEQQSTPPAGTGWMPAPWDPVQAGDAIRLARQAADAVIVSIHWGYEYQTRLDPAQRQIAQLILEAGADLLIGHHPHVVQSLSVHTRPGAPDQVVAYSLGNFVFDQQFDQTREGLALRLFFDRQGLRGVQALPLASGPQPQWMDAEQSATLWDRIRLDHLPTSLQRQTLGFICSREVCAPTAPPETAQSGIFRSGEIDLTGDRIPETVRLENHRAAIYQHDLLVWESPLEWQVLDLALGDADHDGRYELALAFFKPDADGILRSHPFLIGYRGGLYRTLWGGSAVADPLLEVELGDLDGDGLQELLVLEQSKDGQGRAVTFWRWHGWGFSLDWRSPLGNYEDMLYIPANDPHLASIRVFVGR